RLLDKLDVPVVVSRNDSAARAEHGLLIVAEPVVTDGASRARLAALVGASRRVLLVLPKWYGSLARGKRWIEGAHLLPERDRAAVLEAIASDAHAEIHRTPATGSEFVPGGRHPVIREPQLIASEQLSEIVADRTGDRLLGKTEHDGTELYLLSDPDVLSN